MRLNTLRLVRTQTQPSFDFGSKLSNVSQPVANVAREIYLRVCTTSTTSAATITAVAAPTNTASSSSAAAAPPPSSHSSAAPPPPTAATTALLLLLIVSTRFCRAPPPAPGRIPIVRRDGLSLLRYYECTRPIEMLPGEFLFCQEVAVHQDKSATFT